MFYLASVPIPYPICSIPDPYSVPDLYSILIHNSIILFSPDLLSPPPPPPPPLPVHAGTGCNKTAQANHADREGQDEAEASTAYQGGQEDKGKGVASDNC